MRNLLREGLRRLVDTPARAPRGKRNAQVIAVAAQKGGVGKTTSAVNLAASLCRHHDLHTLLIDLDPQAHVSTALRAMLPTRPPELSALLERAETGDLMDAVVSTRIPNLYATIPDPALGETEARLASKIGKEFVLRAALETARTHHDIIVLDCPPNSGTLTVNALAAADFVLVPCDPGPLALRSVETLLATLGTVAERINPRLDLLGVVLTRVDGRNTTLNQRAITQLGERLGDALCPVRIGINTSLAQAQETGQDIFAASPRSRGADDYRELARWVLQELASRTPQA